jgi:hypothetical protein
MTMEQLIKFLENLAYMGGRETDPNTAHEERIN